MKLGFNMKAIRNTCNSFFKISKVSPSGYQLGISSAYSAHTELYIFIHACAQFQNFEIPSEKKSGAVKGIGKDRLSADS